MANYLRARRHRFPDMSKETRAELLSDEIDREIAELLLIQLPTKTGRTVDVSARKHKALKCREQ